MLDPHSRPPRGHSRRRLRTCVLEGLEPRVVLSAGNSPASIVLLSASTADSRGVTVDYSVADPSGVSTPIDLGVYRSADATFDAGDEPVASLHLGAAGGVGVHRVTIPIPGGLPPVPDRPYVLVVSDPSDPGASTDPGRTASIHVHVIGIITHGGLQDKSQKYGPPWELGLARALRKQGYDAVIPFSWVAQSSHPGAAVKQGPRLARMVRTVAGRFPASEPVDLHFIGHSEGTVVNSVAARDVEAQASPAIRAGYVEMTMLDPHAASGAVAGTQYSVSDSPLGWIARIAIDDYQAKANDPIPFVPAGVDAAQVFYQHTPVSHAHGENLGIYNLWGQVPVRGQAHYFNVTAAGVTHSGSTGIVVWYRRHVVPTLGDGPGFVDARALTGGLGPGEGAAVVQPRREGSAVRVQGSRPSFSGTAAPGSVVHLLAGPVSDPSALARVGRTVAGPDGAWSARTRPLASGPHRFLAVARRADDPERSWRSVVTMAPLGRVDVLAGRSRSGEAG